MALLTRTNQNYQNGFEPLTVTVATTGLLTFISICTANLTCHRANPFGACFWPFWPYSFVMTGIRMTRLPLCHHLRQLTEKLSYCNRNTDAGQTELFFCFPMACPRAQTPGCVETEWNLPDMEGCFCWIYFQGGIFQSEFKSLCFQML